MKKNKYIKLFILCSIIIMIAYFCIGMYFGFQAERFRSQVLFALSENVINIQCIPYDYLSKQYKEKVNREQYNEAITAEEVVEILKLFNEVPHELEPTKWITTDGFKTYPLGEVEINGEKYQLHHHIDFSVKKFKPYVVRWCVDIKKLE